jgi:hypothetical protein
VAHRAENSEHSPLIQAQQWDVLESVLTDPDFLESKVASGLVFALVEDFAVALDNLPLDRPGRRMVELVGRAIRREASFLARHRGSLFQCLWNLGWWHDSHRVGDFSALVETWRKSKEKRGPNFTWVRSLRPPIISLDIPLLPVLPLPSPRTRASLSFSAEGERLAAHFAVVEGDVPFPPLLWDVSTGQPLPLYHFVLEGRGGGGGGGGD